jgi:hypothetical protein
MFRIIKKPKGYIVEYLEYKWSLFGLKKIWKPFIKASGLDEPWHHSTYESAMMNLIYKLKRKIENL